uniref:Uncharacterized protein n=1 Tax=Hippocampus comes TaxID=109280 RepID=A0A3Q2XUK7_HIPCM
MGGSTSVQVPGGGSEGYHVLKRPTRCSVSLLQTERQSLQTHPRVRREAAQALRLQHGHSRVPRGVRQAKLSLGGSGQVRQ